MAGKAGSVRGTWHTGSCGGGGGAAAGITVLVAAAVAVSWLHAHARGAGEAVAGVLIALGGAALLLVLAVAVLAVSRARRVPLVTRSGQLEPYQPDVPAAVQAPAEPPREIHNHIHIHGMTPEDAAEVIRQAAGRR